METLSFGLEVRGFSVVILAMKPCVSIKQKNYLSCSRCCAGKNTIIKVIKSVHEGSVFSICVLKEGSIITGGGKDGRIIQFDNNLQRTGYEAQVCGKV